MSAVKVIGRALFAVGCAWLAVFMSFAVWMVIKNADGGPELWMFTFVPLLIVGALLAWCPSPFRWIKHGR